MLNERIDNYLLSKMKQKREREQGIYYASELSFSADGIEEMRNRDITLADLRIFEIGHIFHNFIQQNIFPDGEHEVRVKYDVNDNIKIIGRADIVLDDTVIELKTTSRKVELFKENHLAQITFYMHALGMKKGKIIYINKTNFEVYEFDVSYVKSFWDEIENAVREHYEKYSVR